MVFQIIRIRVDGKRVRGLKRTELCGALDITNQATSSLYWDTS